MKNKRNKVKFATINTDRYNKDFEFLKTTKT